MGSSKLVSNLETFVQPKRFIAKYESDYHQSKEFIAEELFVNRVYEKAKY